MKIKDYMTKEVVTVSPSTGIREVYELFKQTRYGSLPVVDAERHVVGVITKRELLTVLLPDYFNMLDSMLFVVEDFGALEEEFEHEPIMELFIAADLMVREVVTVSEDASLLKAPALMQQFNVRRLPVLDKEGKLSGIITRGDICKAFFER